MSWRSLESWHSDQQRYAARLRRERERSRTLRRERIWTVIFYSVITLASASVWIVVWRLVQTPTADKPHPAARSK